MSGEQKRKLSMWEVLLGGCAAGSARAVLETPLELAKVRRQLGQQWTVKSLYTGLGVTWVRCCALLGSFFVLVDATAPLRKDLPPFLDGFAKGSVCATVSWWICFPFDVLKSQVQSTAHQGQGSAPLSMSDRARILYQTYGIRGFFRGIVPGTLRSFVANGCAMAAYEMTRKALS
jgi:solute carrier family 25 carnitine/acylcarnitine transporter 20/29